MRWTGGAALAGVAAALALGGGAQAAQLCGWMVETKDPERNYHELEIWLEADKDVAFFYKLAGDGIVQDEGGSGHAPNSGTYVLHPGEAQQPWGFGMTLYGAGRIDVVMEIREKPVDIFSDEETPLLTTFTFRRRVPEDELDPPADLAARQCAEVAAER